MTENDRQWVDNIPESGILCWVSDIFSKPDETDDIANIVTFEADSFRFISANDVDWRYATPIPSEIIEQWLKSSK